GVVARSAVLARVCVAVGANVARRDLGARDDRRIVILVGATVVGGTVTVVGGTVTVVGGTATVVARPAARRERDGETVFRVQRRGQRVRITSQIDRETHLNPAVFDGDVQAVEWIVARLVVTRRLVVVTRRLVVVDRRLVVVPWRIVAVTRRLHV